MKSIFYIFTKISLVILLLGCSKIHEYDLSTFHNEQKCYDRKNSPYTFIADSHLHYRAFGGKSIPFSEVNEYLEKSGVLFANVYGIGQILPIDSNCTYYLNCPGVPANPSIKNDFVNAANYVENKPKNVHLTLSMTFPDLSNPDDIVQKIKLYDKEYPGLFKWMGEVNLIKQALLNNNHTPSNKSNIRQWKSFMKLLEKRDIPINIHSDLGNNNSHTKYLYLMEYVLSLYPNNKIVWAHMGLSKELTDIDPELHISIMSSMLDKYKKLMLDISWRVLEDNYFSNTEYRKHYVKFFNKYHDRILPGTDFVASRNKDFSTYKKEIEVNSRINQYLSDEAFRSIALGGNYFKILGLGYTAPKICNQ